MDKSIIILSAETQFAREVTLGVIYQLPLPIWYSLIPGMFIFDFLRRNTAIRRYTKYFLSSRKMALDAAQSFLNGEEKSFINDQIKSKIENRLNSINLISQDLTNAQIQVVNLLIKHYIKLINAVGASYNELVGNAYKTPTAFKVHLNSLEKVEIQIDKAIIKQKNKDKKLKEKLQLEAEQVKLRRNKIIENIF